MKPEINFSALAEFVNAVEQKERLEFKLTNDLLVRVRPTVLDALYDLFEVPNSDVEWFDIQYMDDVIILVCEVTFVPDKASAFLQNTFKLENTKDPVTKALRLGVPITDAFTSKEAVINFLTYAQVVSEEDQELINSSDNHMFDVESLTDSQRASIELFKSCVRGVKN